MKAMTVVAIAIGTRNHGINGKTLGVYLRSAESCHFRNIRRKPGEVLPPRVMLCPRVAS